MMHENLSKVLVAPVISEKATRLGDRHNTVVFWVNPKSTKQEIKNAVEVFFKGVKVLRVRTLIQGSRWVRFGQTQGRTKKTKKAYVTLAEGVRIDFTELD